MANINGGYVALVVVGIVFLGLQFWWISMTIKNERNEKVLLNQNQTDEIKKRLEKIFSNFRSWRVVIPKGETKVLLR